MSALDSGMGNAPVAVRTALALAFVCIFTCATAVARQKPPLPESKPTQQAGLRLNDREYFETRGLNVLVFTNQRGPGIEESSPGS